MTAIQKVDRLAKTWIPAWVFLLAVDYPYQPAMYSRSLLAYPKLIRSLFLWDVTVTRMSA